MDPLLISTLGEALILVLKKLGENVSDPLLKKSAEPIVQWLAHGYDQKRDEARLRAALDAAIQDVKRSVRKQYPFEVALQTIKSSPKLAMQVATVAVGMAMEIPERVPLDLLHDLYLDEKSRSAFAKFLFCLRKQLAGLDGFRTGIEYADRLEQHGWLSNSLLAIRRQTEIYEAMLIDRHLTLDDEKALQDYLDHVRRQSQSMPLPLTRQHTLGERTDADANEVFVPLTLLDLEAGQPNSGNLKTDCDANRPATFAEIFNLHQCFLLKGPPGCGKTTLLHRSALAFASGTAQADLGWTGPALLPIFLRLRNFGVFLAENRGKFTGPAYGALTAFMENHFQVERRINLSPRFFDRRLEEGRCLVLLDGLDEVAAGREEVAQFVTAFILEYGKYNNHFGLASRPKGYETVEFSLRRAQPQPAVVEVNPLDANGIRKLVANLFMTLDPDPEQRAKDIVNLPEAILASPKLRIMAGTPLFCAALVLVYRYHGAHLPQRRVEVYSQIIDLLLGLWKATDPGLADVHDLVAKGTNSLSLDVSKIVDIKKKRLSYLALWMQEKGLSDVPANLAKKVLRDYLKNVEGKKSDLDQQVDDFLESAYEFSGLFVEAEADRYAFTHQGFREYLAATALKNKREKDFISLIREHATDDWWEEVILLTGAHPELADELRYYLVEMLLDSAIDTDLSAEKRHGSLLMAGQCAADMAFLPDPQREQVVKKLYEAMTCKELEPKKRLQAGETLDALGWVPPDLKSFIYIPNEEGFWIAKYPVTNWQYMQFVSSVDYADSKFWKSVQGFDVDGQPLEGIGEQAWQWFTQNGEKETHPRFWDDAHFGALRRLFPVVGVSWYEAAAYCAWLNRHYKEQGISVPGEVSFRLPREQEWIYAFQEQGDQSASGESLSPKVTRQTVSMYANTYESDLHRTTPVCMYPDGKNSTGLMDLNGNVWEWQANQRNRGKLEIALRGGAWTNSWGEDGIFPAIDDAPSGCGKSCGFRVLMYSENRGGTLPETNP